MPDSIELGPFVCVHFCFDFVACLEKKSSINAIFIYIFRLKKKNTKFRIKSTPDTRILPYLVLRKCVALLRYWYWNKKLNGCTFFQIRLFIIMITFTCHVKSANNYNETWSSCCPPKSCCCCNISDVFGLDRIFSCHVRCYF